MKKFAILLVTILFHISGCAAQTELQTTILVSGVGNPIGPNDANLMRVAEKLPEFGGMYFDEKGDLKVYVVEDVGKMSATELKKRTGQVEKALTAVLGKEFLDRGMRQDLEREYQKSIAPRLILIRGEYSITQLLKWRINADRVLDFDGVVFTDLDERHNRVKIGIDAEATRNQISTTLKKLGIPSQAVIIDVVKPIIFFATLRSELRPPPGGVQVEADTGLFANKKCTLGFNVIRSGVSGFITNSHCTKTRGISQGTDFHQPDDPWWTEKKKIGDESADPPFFTGGVCPTGRQCRYSDSAFIDYKVSRGQNIARTTGWNNGSLTISSSPTKLTIEGEASSWVDGSELDKIGRTSGWTYGRVNGTCQNVNVAGTNVTLLCQYRVNRIPGQTHSMAAPGDSGSPVFRWQGETVILSGILWGGPADKSAFVFSPMNQIEQELGPLTTFDFPSPPSPPGPQHCPTGQKCCLWDLIQGKPVCILCIPAISSCPGSSSDFVDE